MSRSKIGKVEQSLPFELQAEVLTSLPTFDEVLKYCIATNSPQCHYGDSYLWKRIYQRFFGYNVHTPNKTYKQMCFEEMNFQRRIFTQLAYLPWFDPPMHPPQYDTVFSDSSSKFWRHMYLTYDWFFDHREPEQNENYRLLCVQIKRLEGRRQLYFKAYAGQISFVSMESREDRYLELSNAFIRSVQYSEYMHAQWGEKIYFWEMNESWRWTPEQIKILGMDVNPDNGPHLRGLTDTAQHMIDYLNKNPTSPDFDDNSWFWDIWAFINFDLCGSTSSRSGFSRKRIAMLLAKMNRLYTTSSFQECWFYNAIQDAISGDFTKRSVLQTMEDIEELLEVWPGLPELLVWKSIIKYER